MASFVEQATLLLKDDASKNIGKVNRELKQLFATAKKMRDVKINVRVESNATRALNSLVKSAAQLKSLAGTRTFRINTLGAEKLANVLALFNRAQTQRRAQLSIDIRGQAEFREFLRLVANETRTRRRISVSVNVENLNKLREAARALSSLQAMARKRIAGAVPLVSSRQIVTLNSITSVAHEAATAVDLIGKSGPSAGLREILTIVKSIAAEARSAQQALSGFGRSGRTRMPGGGAGAIPTPQSPVAQPIARLPWRSFGSQIGFGFRATVGSEIFQALRRSGRSAGEGILTADDARVIALASLGGNREQVSQLTASAGRASDSVSGVATGLIVEAAIEQTASLAAQLKKGTISQAQFDTRLNETTRRIAENAQIFGTFNHDMERGAEQARQTEKVLALLGTTLDPSEQRKFNEALRNSTLAVGGDVDPGDTKKKLQQLGSTVAQSLSPEGLANVIALVDEGGAQAIKEIRTGFQDLFRGNLNKKDKAAMIAAGLRNLSGGESVFTQKDFADPIAFAIQKIIPRLEKANVDMSDPILVQNAMDNLLGFTGEGARLWARIIPNLSQMLNEIEKRNIANPDILLNEPTLRTTLADVNAKFQNAAVTLTQGLLPTFQKATAGLADTFERISRGEVPSADQLAGIGAAAMGVSAIALLDPATRPLGAAGLALTGAAASLTAAAVALGGQSVLGAVGLGKLGVVGAGAGATLLASGSVLEGQFTGAVGKVTDAFSRLAQALVNPTDAVARVLGGEGKTPVTDAITSWLRSQFENFSKVQPIDTRGESISETRAQLTELTTLMKQRASVDADTREMTRMMNLERQDAAAPQIGAEVARGLGEGMGSATMQIQTAFGIGAQQISSAGTTAATTIQGGLTTGGVSAGQSIAAQMIAAAQQAGAAIANAISSASSQINVNVRQQAAPAAAAPNTGATGGGL